MVGPKVRAAGRIVLQRPGGKLIFVDIRDMTGQIQLFIGQKQVGDELGNSPSASTWATSSASTANSAAPRPASSRSSSRSCTSSPRASPPRPKSTTASPIPNSASGCGTSTSPTPTACCRGSSTAPRSSVDPRHARPARLRRSRRPDAALDRRRRRGPAVQDASQRARHRSLPADRPRAASQAAAGRRHRTRLRTRPRLPQRRHQPAAQPRVHDARGLPGLRRLPHR